MTLLSALLAAVVSPWFLLLTAAFSANQLLMVATSACPAARVIDRLAAQRT